MVLNKSTHPCDERRCHTFASIKKWNINENRLDFMTFEDLMAVTVNSAIF
jgi:hypothetical protein